MGIIAKASQRANGQELAVHLQNARDNERIEIVHVRGAVAQDLSGAFEEWHAISKATKCRKYLYSLSLNPDPGQGPLTRRQYRDYIRRVEKKLKLADQPRVIVFHIKEGREHCHVVWSRIISAELKAVPISHDRKSLQTITRAFAKDHGLTLPPGMAAAGERENGKARTSVTLHERHQQDRTGDSKNERVAEITALWNRQGGGQEFVLGLAQAGYHLARGSSAPYVVVDRHGELHSLARQIDGVRTKEIRARLAKYPPELLPDAAAVREQVRQRIAAEITGAFNRRANAPWIELHQSQHKRRGVFHAQLSAMKERHQDERRAILKQQKTRLQEIREIRLRREATGLRALLYAIPVIRMFVASRHRKHDFETIRAFRMERQIVLARQRAEFEDLKRQARAILRVEKREHRSLKTSLQRDFLRARSAGGIADAQKPADLPARTSAKALSLMEFRINAEDMTIPCGPSEDRKASDRTTIIPANDALAGEFSQSASPPPPALRSAFTEAEAPLRKTVKVPTPGSRPK